MGSVVRFFAPRLHSRDFTMPAIPDPMRLGPLDLLVIQPTPFCNLDCSYCYLPDRQKRKRITTDILDHTFHRVFTSGLIEHPITVIWHAGEPLVLPPAFYRDAIQRCERHNVDHVEVTHSVQPNGTLITPEWCELFREYGIRVGVSVDGPAFLHDRFRKTRSGQGTLERVLAGIRLLQEYEVPFSTISVLTSPALDYPDELFEFFREHGITRIGFNVEEVEGPHKASSLDGADIPDRYAAFLSRFYDLAMAASPPMQVREFAVARDLTQGPPPDGPFNHQAAPMAIVSVDCEGNFTTFSPELVGLPAPEYGGFALGNVASDTLQSAAASPRFRAIAADVAEGVRKCKNGCPYFAYCGGGAPVNKYFENGSFATANTMYCKLGIQTVTDVVLDKLLAAGVR